MLGVTCSSFSQSRKLDSLIQVVKANNKDDTTLANTLNKLSGVYTDVSLDSSQKYVDKALKLSQDLNYTNGIISAKITQGIIYRFSNRPKEAIALYQQLADLATEKALPEKLIRIYGNLGGVYYETNEYAKALNCFLKALKTATDFKDVQKQLIMLNNIGLCYGNAGLYDESIEAYKKALQLNKVIKNEFMGASINLNIASVYEHQGLKGKALGSYKASCIIFKKLGNTRQLGIALYNIIFRMINDRMYDDVEPMLKEIQEVADQLKEDKFYASVYEAKCMYFNVLEKYQPALKEIDQAIALTDTVNEPKAYSTRLLRKAEILIKTHQYEAAMRCCDLSNLIAKKMDDKSKIAQGYMVKSENYVGMGNYKLALACHKYSDSIADLLTTESFAAKTAMLNSLNELDKKEKELQLSLQEKESMHEKHKTQTVLLIATVVVAILVVVLLLISLRANSLRKKSYTLLLKQKREIQRNNIVLVQHQQKIEHQKLQLENKQMEIHDSMRYAHTIQKTLMANQALIDQHLKEHFILYKPKDIVSGDFYWALEKNNYFYLAVCDCTGHGVPGAFMSLLNIAFLNEAVIDKKITEPHEILNYVRDKLINSVSKDGGQDGMDCVLMAFDKKTNLITYAAANNKVLLVREAETILFQSDKMPVGKGMSSRSFSLNTLQAEKGDMVYLFSDGYADQFGGIKGKKFKYKQLEKILLANRNAGMNRQKEILETLFDDWKGNLEQVDDVTVIGIKI